MSLKRSFIFLKTPYNLLAVHDVYSCLMHHSTYVVTFRSVWTPEQVSCFFQKSNSLWFAGGGESRWDLTRILFLKATTYFPKQHYTYNFIICSFQYQFPFTMSIFYNETKLKNRNKASILGFNIKFIITRVHRKCL
jgi:hypothetical protein